MRKGVFCLILSSLIWGLVTPLDKIALYWFTPKMLLLIQLAASCIFLWLIIFFQNLEFRRDIFDIRVVSLGFLEPFISGLLFVFGLKLTTASNTSFIYALESLLVVLLSALLLRKKIAMNVYFLAFLAFIGVLLISDVRELKISNIGDSFILCSVLAGAFYTIFSSLVVKGRNVIVILAVQQLFATIALFLFSLDDINSIIAGTTQIEIKYLLFVIALGIISMAFAFLLFLVALQNLEPYIVGFGSNVIPIFALITAYILLGELFNLIQFAGAIIVLTATSLILFGKDKASKEVE